MTKIVSDTHIIGDRGVISFRNYCNRHEPLIIFREIKEHDYGIDAEIEKVNFKEGKKVASGEILKIQLKSTAKQNSYMRNATESGFDFYASSDDFEYWANCNLDVILVIYDDKEDKLYAKKINKTDYALYATNKKKKSFPLRFDAKETELILGANNFYTVIKESFFKPRYDTTIAENLFTNFHSFSQFPKIIYVYDSLFKTKKELYNALGGVVIPPIALYGHKIYTFLKIHVDNKTFREEIISSTEVKVFSYLEIIKDKDLLNHYLELLNLYIRAFATNDRGLWVDRKRKREFFFPKPMDSDILKVNFKTRKREDDGERTVVKLYQYAKDVFYRHLGFTYQIELIGDLPVLILNYKYHFTKDGSVELSPKKITKFTNKLNSLEYNIQVLNHLYFWFQYLSEGNAVIDIYSSDNLKIKLSRAMEIKTDFGIYKPKNFIPPKVVVKPNTMQSDLFNI